MVLFTVDVKYFCHVRNNPNEMIYRIFLITVSFRLKLAFVTIY